MSELQFPTELDPNRRQSYFQEAAGIIAVAQAPIIQAARGVIAEKTAQAIILVGPHGAGKSTIANTIANKNYNLPSHPATPVNFDPNLLPDLGTNEWLSIGEIGRLTGGNVMQTLKEREIPFVGEAAVEHLIAKEWLENNIPASFAVVDVPFLQDEIVSKVLEEVMRVRGCINTLLTQLIAGSITSLKTAIDALCDSKQNEMPYIRIPTGQFIGRDMENYREVSPTGKRLWAIHNNPGSLDISSREFKILERMGLVVNRDGIATLRSPLIDHLMNQKIKLERPGTELSAFPSEKEKFHPVIFRI